jgi:tetratricopeptide (TPR) repeat protein
LASDEQRKTQQVGLEPDARGLTVKVRAAVALVLAPLFLWCAWGAIRAGASRMVSDYAERAGALAAADEAVALTPADPEALYTRANLLADAGEYRSAARAYEQAIGLRRRDHVLWTELGRAREEAGDSEGALAALREAATLAPSYARPRWLLGNALLRAGRREEADEELRRAAESDPLLYPNLLQTLWRADVRDPRALVRDARPRTSEQALAVVRLLLKEGDAADALKTLRESGVQLTPEARRSLVAELIAAEGFAEAYEVWSGGRVGATTGALADGGFEGEIRTDEEGFGWRFAREARGVAFSLDSDSPREGGRSLKVEYAGAPDPAARTVSQLIPVEPGGRYRLAFSARTKELVTGGPPFVAVVSAAGSGESLAAAPPLPAGTNDWQDISLEFTAPNAGAVRVTLARQPCTTSPCPAFGSVWLDAFELREVSGGRGK